MGKLERDFQSDLIKELSTIYPDAIVTKLDANHIQGIPDLLILHGNQWATLECKVSKNATKRPNQDYYSELMNNMSFSRIIYPENKQEVLNELQQALKP